MVLLYVELNTVFRKDVAVSLILVIQRVVSVC